jgi:endonuclease/exonuclease/phosphatase family metal-dependent hydrolase
MLSAGILWPLHAGSQLSRDRTPVRGTQSAQAAPEPLARFTFDGTVDDAAGTHEGLWIAGYSEYTNGLAGQALRLPAGRALALRTSAGNALSLRSSEDFSVRFWARTVQDSDTRFVLVSQKDFGDNSIAAQKEAGWVFYVSGGTWAWNMGSGDRRITYERENGRHMPLNDGRWHQLTMTYSSDLSEVRLFYDGENRVTYHVSDGEGFDFTSTNPLVLGWAEEGNESPPAVLPGIRAGAEQLQRYVDTFNGLGLEAVEADEFASLIVDPRGLFEQKVEERASRLEGEDRATFLQSMSSVDFEPISELEAALMGNPYTVHQVMNFMETAPLLKIYSLVDGTVTISRDEARDHAARERLDAPDFDIDDLEIWDRVLSAEEVLDAYSEHFVPASHELEDEVSLITAAAWNIWHGGKHFTVEEHGWDSRVAIAQILEREGVDIVMMQETYSAGDFIAAELGYYFATTVDWDYLNQGSNISVLSRYPIKELHVQDDSPFMNVGTRIAISESQDLYAMSNWYGMTQFPAVFDFHESRFRESDRVPTIFAGDFNAVPHTDGGDSPASRALLDAGFTDAFRSLHPDVGAHPGYTHRSGRRIDQLYYKGSGLKNTSTRLISTWPAGFPSDHYLIRAAFELDYTTRGGR